MKISPSDQIGIRIVGGFLLLLLGIAGILIFHENIPLLVVSIIVAAIGVVIPYSPN